MQVNSRIRAKLTLPADAGEKAAEEAAVSMPEILPFLEGKMIRKVIVRKNIINIVVG